MTLARARWAPRVLVIAAALLLLALAGSARAASFTVDDSSDPNPPSACTDTSHCTLRGAVIAANTDADKSNAITIAPGTGPYDLSSSNGSLGITKNLTINGGGATLDGGDEVRIFDIGTCGNQLAVSMNSLTITNGAPVSTSHSGDGGGIYANNTTLTLSQVAVTGNDASGLGGGVYAETVPNPCPTTSPINLGIVSGLNIDHSEISSNTSSGAGGGIASRVPLTVTDTTVSDNHAGPNAGGIAVGGQGTTQLLNDTIAFNVLDEPDNVDCSTTPCTTADGAGVGVISKSEFSPQNTIISNNTANVPVAMSVQHAGGQQVTHNCDTFSNTLDYNLSDDESCGLTAAHDTEDQDPGLGALQNNGGPTRTRGITQSSVAFDHSDSNGCPADDQRGVIRPQFSACDTGAFELQAPPAGPSADVSLTKTVSPNSVNVGQNVTFTLTSANSGPNDATNTVVTDTLPAGVAFVSDSASQGSCTGTTSITCHLGTVAAGAHATITIVVRVTNAGQFVNSANVTADPADPNGANNHASASFIGVNPAAPSCIDTRKFKFALHKFRKARIVDVVVFINNKKAAHKKGHNLRSITISKLPQQVFKVKIVSTQSTGSKLISTRTYNGCIKSKPKTTAVHIHPHYHHHG